MKKQRGSICQHYLSRMDMLPFSDSIITYIASYVISKSICLGDYSLNSNRGFSVKSSTLTTITQKNQRNSVQIMSSMPVSPHSTPPLLSLHPTPKDNP